MVESWASTSLRDRQTLAREFQASSSRRLPSRETLTRRGKWERKLTWNIGWMDVLWLKSRLSSWLQLS